VRASMELGGNAPFLVLEGADVEAAVAGAMTAKMRNGGSACTAANRFYVHRSLAEPFTRRLAEEMQALRLGPGLDEGSQLGALVSPLERDKIAALVGGAVAAGARCLTGGAAPGGAGAFYPATVLVDVAPDADLLRQEIFGPVAPVVVVDDDDEAVRLANDTEYGLIAYVYAPDEAHGTRVAHRIQAGMIAVNRGVVSDPAAPFGGMKQSGLGREGGFAGIHEFLESKYIALTERPVPGPGPGTGPLPDTTKEHSDMKVSVDQTVCQAYANCIVEAPEVFDLDEENGKVVALVVEPDPSEEEQVRTAALACPVRAITLHE
jgi:succinate-semialdehyde dehydrogenase / glutarate-semialdehyde dehydrogenase